MQANTGNKLHKYTLGLQDVLKVQILIESVFRTGSAPCLALARSKDAMWTLLRSCLS